MYLKFDVDDVTLKKLVIIKESVGSLVNGVLSPEIVITILF